MKNLLATTALLALCSNAGAQPANVGETVRFLLPTVACTDSRDAQEALRLRMLYGPSAAESLVYSRHDYAGNRWCTILSKEDWQVLRKYQGPNTAPEDAWLCVVTTKPFDVGPPEKHEVGPAKDWCFWVFTRGHDARRPFGAGLDQGYDQ